MAMSVSALEILEEAQFAPLQARALARALEVEVGAHRQDLATKSDLAQLQQATKADIEQLRQATKSDLAQFEQAMKTEFATVRGDIAKERQATKTDIADAKVEMIRWTLLTMMTYTTLLAGIVYFLLQNML